MRIGLVLEGGGMRGLYTAGVIDAMMQHGFMPDVICGTSAGVTFGINLPSRQEGRVLRYNTKYAGDKRYISLRSLLLTGNIVNTNFAYRDLPNELDPYDYETFKASGVEFYATMTNVGTGLAEYVRLEDCRKQMDCIRASASLPFVSRMVKIGGAKYLDGGIADNIPFDKCLELGCDKIIVVLTHPRDYVRHESLSTLGRILYPFRKNLHRAFDRRNEVYNSCLDKIRRLEDEGKVFVMSPSADIKVGRLESDPSRLAALHAHGLSDMTTRWPSLLSYLSSPSTL